MPRPPRREPRRPGATLAVGVELTRAPVRTGVHAGVALMAFAANSLLCRAALLQTTIDPASFTSVRLVSGALTLWAISVMRPSQVAGAASWTSAALLALYAVPFAFAYDHLGAGTGALILFGSVQLTMLLVAVMRGERPRVSEWIGLLVAFGGLVYLVSPGLSAPSPGGAALMMVAGASWGVYSLRGRGVADPLAQTSVNFMRAVPFALLASGVLVSSVRI